MPKKLTAAFLQTAKRPGVYGDEHGLRLRVMPTGSKQWIWRGTVNGRRRDIGLGGYPYTTLADARGLAYDYRKLARTGGDPETLRQRARIPTFSEAADAVVAVRRKGWKSGGRQEAIWRRTVEQYAMPCFGRRRIDQVTTADVMAVLLPEWYTKNETMKRLRQYLGAVFQWAVAHGYRQDNPAGDAIGMVLPKGNRVVKHFRALPHGEVAAALETVQETDAHWATKAAFSFLVHCAARSGEVRSAEWTEIDTDAALWIIPASRTKTRREHRAPLTESTLAMLDEARGKADRSGLIFPSATGRTMSDSTLSKLVRENGIGAPPHGFRSSFRDWCGDTGVAREVAEACLAHVVANAVEAAYARSDLLDRRRKVMEGWSQYLAGAANAKVVPLRV